MIARAIRIGSTILRTGILGRKLQYIDYKFQQPTTTQTKFGTTLGYTIKKGLKMKIRKEVETKEDFGKVEMSL